MAGARIPGPLGTHKDAPDIDSGTLARTATPRPGPIGLFSGPVKPQGKSTGSAPKPVPAPKFAIEVHQLSKITAEEWLKKIKACDEVPDYIKVLIETKNPLIYVPKADAYPVPNDVIKEDWLDDWASAFVGGEWEMTSGNLKITVTKGGPQGSDITGVLEPDLSGEETIAGLTKFAGLTETGHTSNDFKVQYGNTMPDGVTLSSKRKKLIVIVNRVTLHLGDKTTMPFAVTDSELVKNWFHEISCHAGRNTQGKSSGHKDASGKPDQDVNRCASDIERMISKKETTAKIGAAIDDFLKPSKPTHP